MGYFANGTEGLDYQERWCNRCVHNLNALDRGCALWMQQYLENSECANDPENKHILNRLIPRADDGLSNEQCRMFLDAGTKIDDGLEYKKCECCGAIKDSVPHHAENCPRWSL